MFRYCTTSRIEDLLSSWKYTIVLSTYTFINALECKNFQRLSDWIYPLTGFDTMYCLHWQICWRRPWRHWKKMINSFFSLSPLFSLFLSSFLRNASLDIADSTMVENMLTFEGYKNLIGIQFQTIKIDSVDKALKSQVTTIPCVYRMNSSFRINDTFCRGVTAIFCSTCKRNAG